MGRGMKKKKLIVIYNLSADNPPSLDTNLARAGKEELEYDVPAYDMRGGLKGDGVRRGKKLRRLWGRAQGTPALQHK